MKNISCTLATAIALLASVSAQAAVVTVWDTFDGTPISNGMSIGSSNFQGVQFVPSSSGFFVGFTFGGFLKLGADDWVFTLRADSSGTPGSLLETAPPIDVALSLTDTASVYNGTASGTTFLTANTAYWLMAQGSASLGIWSQIETGTGTRASCKTGLPCSEFLVSTDGNAGALEVRVETSPVPLPAAAWMLLSGLGGLGFLGRRRKAS